MSQHHIYFAHPKAFCSVLHTRQPYLAGYNAVFHGCISCPQWGNFLSTVGAFPVHNIYISWHLHMQTCSLLSTVCFIEHLPTAFCTYYTVDGLFRERGFETLAYVLGVVAVLLYVIINYARNYEIDHVFKLVRLTYCTKVGNKPLRSQNTCMNNTC